MPTSSGSHHNYQSCEIALPDIVEGDDDGDEGEAIVTEIPIGGGDDGEENENPDEEDDDKSVLTASSSSDSERIYRYNWRQFAPSTGRIWHYFRWLMVGGGRLAKPQSDAALNKSLAGLARCLILLRRYLDKFGMPDKGGVRDQEYVLKEVIRDLYSGGCPLWALEPVMQKAAEGLTGHPNVNWMLLPRKAFVYSPSSGTTSMFKIERGFNIRRMDQMEKVAVRLATFASNVQSVSNVPARFPNPLEFTRAARTESVRNLTELDDPKQLARQILRLASKNEGLFYYVNSQEYAKSHAEDTHGTNENGDGDNTHITNGKSNNKRPMLTSSAVKDFWVVTDEERELFSRLACQEAMRHVENIDKMEKAKGQTNPWLVMLYRVLASAGACAFWFGGGWIDMVVSGALAVVVALIGSSSILSKQERLVYETIASFVVGLTASLIAHSWPNHTCFAAMAISGVLDILQGFRVVYSIIEIMSKHTVAGSADLLEGILFTGLIAYFLRFGQYLGDEILKFDEGIDSFSPCTNGINQLWYILFVPLAAISWSGLFSPSRTSDIPLMAFHGILGYSINFLLTKAGATNELNNFLAASAVSFSAGIISRFTGRQAVGNTVAGLYVLLPGAYLVKSLYSPTIDGSFFTEVISQAIIIGIGAWSGTILCSPTLLGTTRGLLGQQLGYSQDRTPHVGSTDNGKPGHRRDDSRLPGNGEAAGTMLFF